MGTEAETYRTVVLGATFAGLGAALTEAEGTLVVERTALVGHEFINSFNPGTGWHETALSRHGASLKEELEERGLLAEDGRVHLPALAPVLYNRIDRSGLRVLLLTEVLAIKQCGDHVEVTLHNASGRSVVRAERLIDTRTNAAAQDGIASKRINAMLLFGGEEQGTVAEPNAPVHPDDDAKAKTEIVPCKLGGELIVKLEIGIEDGWTQARSKLNRLWAERTAEWREWTICAVATSFEVGFASSRPVEEGSRLVLTSAAYRNPLEAFEAGAEAAGRGVG